VDTEPAKTKSFARALGDKVLWVIAFVVAFSAVAYTKNEWLSTSNYERARKDVNKQFEEMRAQAIKENPDQSPGEALRQASIKQGNAQLSTQTDEAKRADMAAGQFLGFWLVNTTTRHDWCAVRGIDISTFTEAFKRNHVALYEKSRRIHGRQPENVDKLESKMLEMLKPTLQQAIEDDMATIGETSKLNPVAVCEAFRDHGESIADEVQVAKLNPALFKALSEAK
jgi:hypothetical protein